MARPRDYRAELEARNTRARAAGFQNYYQQRLARARKTHPGISRAAARGHAPAAERRAGQLLRDLKRLDPGAAVIFTGTERQRDGTWRVGRFDILDPDGSDKTYLIGPQGHGRLPEIADAIAGTGVAVIGAKYMHAFME